jgi:ABC-type phosphate transport system substrate-binding protein
MDLELSKADGEKLNKPAEDVGAGSEQLSAQHKRDASAAGVFSLLFALSQHSIILLFGE